MSVRKTIFALGDAGVNEIAINRTILSLTEKENPVVCFVGTASGDDCGYIEKFYDGFSCLPCQTTHLSLFRLPESNLTEFFQSIEIVYVGGGNTRSLIALWREWHLDSIFKDAWDRGVVMCGPSAGAICWFEQGATDSTPGEINALDCIGLLSGSCCPHYNSQQLRRPRFQELIQTRRMKPGYAADDGVGLLFHDQCLSKVVSFREGAKAYRVEAGEKTAIETVLEPDIFVKEEL